MSSPFADAAFVDAFFGGDLAVTAVYTPATGSPVSTSVIFQNPGAALTLEGGIVTTKEILVQGKTSVFTAAKNNETLTVNAVVYFIIRVMPDGEGVSYLSLSTRALQS